MLDQLLLRHDDQPLWQQSARQPAVPGARRVPHLRRRPGHRRRDAAAPPRPGAEEPLAADDAAHRRRPRAVRSGRITPVATSATLGDQGDPAAMIEFARTVFGEPFDAACVVTESRLTLDEWAGDAAGDVDALGPDARQPDRPAADLTAIDETLADRGRRRPPATLTLARAGRPLRRGPTPRRPDGPCRADEPATPAACRWSRRTRSSRQLVDARPRTPSTSTTSPSGCSRRPGGRRAGRRRAASRSSSHLVAALSHVRARSAGARLDRGPAPVGARADPDRPGRQLDRRVPVERRRRRSRRDGDDPFDGQGRPAFPAIYCRHCGRSGWGVELAPVGHDLDPEDTAIRRHHAAGEGRFRALLYAPAGGRSRRPATGDAERRWRGCAGSRSGSAQLLAGPAADDDPDSRDGLGAARAHPRRARTPTTSRATTPARRASRRTASGSSAARSPPCCR